MDPPGEAREDLWIIYELARRMGTDWGEASAEKTWDEAAVAVARPPRA